MIMIYISLLYDCVYKSEVFSNVGDHHQPHVTSSESCKIDKDKVASADIVDQQQPANISISGDGITSGSNLAQQNPSQMDKGSSDCIYIVRYDYEAQTHEGLTVQKGTFNDCMLPECLHGGYT